MKPLLICDGQAVLSILHKKAPVFAGAFEKLSLIYLSQVMKHLLYIIVLFQLVYQFQNFLCLVFR